MAPRARARRAVLLCALVVGVAGAAASLVGGCGISVLGTLPDDASADGVAPPVPEGGDTPDVAASCTSCAPLPAEWRVVTLVDESGPDAGPAPADAGPAPADAAVPTSCPAGTTGATVLRANARVAAGDCTCACGALPQNPCTSGALRSFFRTGQAACNDGTRDYDVDGGCQVRTGTWSTSFNGAGGDPLPVRVVDCPTTATPPPVLDDGAVTACSAPALPGCGAGEACLPGAGKVCAVRDGTHDCPAGFPDRRPLTSVSDTRACEACSCVSQATSCSNERLTFYDNAACSGGGRGADFDSFCHGLGGSGTPTHMRYTADPNDKTCAAAAVTVGVASGAVAVAPVTVCCR
jgi:hypothetical protein